MSDSLKPHVRAANEALLQERLAEILDARNKAIEMRRTVLRQTYEIDRAINDLRATARFLDIDIEIPEEGEQAATERHRLMRIDREADLRAREQDRGRRQIEFERRRREQQARNAVAHRNIMPSQLAPAPRPEQPEEKSSAEGAKKSSRPPVKELLLEQLNAAGAKGLKAKPMREFIEKTYGETLHEKTVGMTLYRLSQDNLVHRDGHTWFFGPPPPAETENPGVAAPGSNNSDSHEGG